MTVEIVPVPGMPEVRAGHDLAELIGAALRRGGWALSDGDIVVVTQKVVSKAEGRVVPEGPGGKADWVGRETRRVVARRGDLVIAETRHGFVCANAGVDASNVAQGFLSLLPEDPDGSADRIRSTLQSATGASIGVIVTDTFGRPWRTGVVNVAIGCSGLPSVVDLRGSKDALGRELEVTIVALADEVAAAAGLVMGKSDGIPVAIVRGVRIEDPPQPGSALVRASEEDLFRQSALEALQAGPIGGGFGPGDVPRDALLEAVRAACTAEAPDGSRPWLFVSVRSVAAKRRLMAVGPVLPAGAATFVVPAARLPGSTRSGPHRDDFLIAAGGAVHRLMLALHAQGFASVWTPADSFSEEALREAAGLSDEWTPLGTLAVGRPHAEDQPLSPPLDPDPFVRESE